MFARAEQGVIPDESRVFFCMIIANGVRCSSSNEIESAVYNKKYENMNIERTHTQTHTSI